MAHGVACELHAGGEARLLGDAGPVGTHGFLAEGEFGGDLLEGFPGRHQAQDLEFDDGFPPLIIEADGTCEWATFLLTDAAEDEDVTDVDPREVDYSMLEVILDGLTGLAWLQRPLYDDELEMMREHDWPPVLRMDFIRPQALTEDNVLEIRMSNVR